MASIGRGADLLQADLLADRMLGEWVRMHCACTVDHILEYMHMHMDMAHAHARRAHQVHMQHALYVYVYACCTCACAAHRCARTAHALRVIMHCTCAHPTLCALKVREHLLPKPAAPTPSTPPPLVTVGTALLATVCAASGRPAARFLLREQFVHKGLLLVLQAQAQAVHRQCTGSAHAVRMQCACSAHMQCTSHMQHTCSEVHMQDTPACPRLHTPACIPPPAAGGVSPRLERPVRLERCGPSVPGRPPSAARGRRRAALRRPQPTHLRPAQPVQSAALGVVPQLATLVSEMHGLGPGGSTHPGGAPR